MNGKSIFKRLAAVAAAWALLAAPALAADPLPPDPKLVADPAVNFGTLRNGLRYAIMRNNVPAGQVSVRLAMDVGSYDEEDSELGYAHFVEHMAFRSTRQSPSGSFDNRFAAFGVAIGRDQNAFTSLNRTIYQIDLPSAAPEALKMALDFMRGAADGILFSPAAVDLERGVVVAELQARSNPGEAAQRESSRFQGRGLRSAERDPSGTEESLRAATPQALQRFYDRWYRPERAMLVIVGDAPAEQLRRAAEEAFAGWTGRGPAAVRPDPPATIPERGVEALSQSHPALPTAMSACRLGPSDSDRGALLERMRRETLSEIWTGILGSRLGQQATREGSPVLMAGSVVSRDLPDARAACLFLLPGGDKWQPAFSAVQAELRRFAKDGPTDNEVEVAVEQLRSRLRAGLYQSGTRPTAALADQIAVSALAGRPFQHPSEALKTFEMLVAGVTAADVKRAFEEDWSGTGPLLTAMAPSAPSEEALLAAWRDNEAAEPLAAYADADEASWTYWDFGKRGKVRKREEIADPGFVRLHYKNGAILNFKQTAHRSGGVEIRVRFGHGERGLDAASRFPMAVAASLFPMGGLGDLEFQQVALAHANTTWAFSLNVETSAYVLASSTLTDQVEQQLRLLAAYVTDPAFRPLIDEKLPSVVDLVYGAVLTDPGTVALDALERRLHPDRLSMPPREALVAFGRDELERTLGPVLAGSPMEVTIVGDIEEKVAARAMAETFGALPKRPPLAPPAGEGPFRRYPETVPPPVSAWHDGPTDKAAAILLWPLWVASPERRHEEYAVGLVRGVLENRLLQRVRVEMGKVYSPVVSNVMIDDADDGYLAVQIDAAPADIAAIVAAARDIARDMASGSIAEEEIAAARQPMIAHRLQAQSDNAAWAGILSHSWRNPEAIDELVRFDAQLGAVTLDDVRRAAATWLGREPAVATALPRPAAASP